MAFTARELITKAYYLSTVVARQYETVDGEQINVGLELLNALLDVESGACELIPYYTRAGFDMVAGQESYFVENLVQLATCTFFISPGVRFSLQPQHRDRFFGSSKLTNIESIPLSYHVERVTGGSRIYFYFLPSEAFPVEITGKYALTDVDLNTDLSEVYDKFYIEYLRYALADYICQDNDIELGQTKKNRLGQIKRQLKWVSPPDFTLTKISTIGRQSGFDWYDANIAHGWRP